MSEFLYSLNVQNAACLISTIALMLSFNNYDNVISVVGMLASSFSLSCVLTLIIKTNVDGDFQAEDFTGFYVYLWEMQLCTIPILIVLLFICHIVDSYYNRLTKCGITLIKITILALILLIATNLVWMFVPE